MSGLVIDSSGWLEYFTGGKKASSYLKHFESHRPIWTPTLVLYEVYKKIAKERSEAEGLLAVTQIEGRSKALIPFDRNLALAAADLSLKLKLAMADAIIYATSLQQGALLVTSDHHFEGLDHVIII